MSPLTYKESDVADLHLHSIFSDGTHTPENLVKKALEKNLACIALTDHDTLEGCEQTRKLCEQAGIGFVAGIELTAYALDEEVHILGLGLGKQTECFQKKLKEFQDARKERVVTIVHRLNEQGVPLKLEAVLKLANCNAPGRMHVAQALIDAGICTDRDDVFSNYVGNSCPAYVPKINFSIKESVELIHSVGGAAFVAHPGVHIKQGAIVDYAIQMGIDGFECFHPRNSSTTTQRLLAICQTRGLLVSGGSDCHGIKDHLTIGTIRLPIMYVEKLNQWVYSKSLKKD